MKKKMLKTIISPYIPRFTWRILFCLFHLLQSERHLATKLFILIDLRFTTYFALFFLWTFFTISFRSRWPSNFPHSVSCSLFALNSNIAFLIPVHWLQNRMSVAWVLNRIQSHWHVVSPALILCHATILIQFLYVFHWLFLFIISRALVDLSSWTATLSSVVAVVVVAVVVDSNYTWNCFDFAIINSTRK